MNLKYNLKVIKVFEHNNLKSFLFTILIYLFYIILKNIKDSNNNFLVSNYYNSTYEIT